MDNIILLTICIPTYNRAVALDECLKNITSQRGFDKRTEVVVLDNNSTDDTESVVTRYSNDFDNVLHYRNAENIGMEKNIIKVLQFGRGKLLKLLNDYSLFTNGALEDMLAIVEQDSRGTETLFFLNNSTKQAPISCSDLNCFFRETTFWATWISTFSIWKIDFDSFESFDVFEGLLFPHLLMLLKVTEGRKKGIKIVFGKYLTDIGGISKGGYNFYKVFVQNFIGNIIHVCYKKGEINLYTLYKLKAAFFEKFLKLWILKISFGKNHRFDSKNFTLVFKYFKNYPQLYFFVLSIPFYGAFEKLKNFKKSLF